MPIPSQRGDMRSITRWLAMVEVLMLTIGLSTDYSGNSSTEEHQPAKGKFSSSIILTKDNKTLFARAYGMADRETDRENTLDTPINLGSMNKMFTGLAITQLVAQGKLAYSDTVGQYLSDYSNQRVRDEVTVHQLLTHTSGLGSYWNEAYDKNKETLSSVSDFAELFAESPLQFDPGSDEQYSNAVPRLPFKYH